MEDSQEKDKSQENEPQDEEVAPQEKENTPKEREGLQKSIPAIFKGTPAPEEGSKDRTVADRPEAEKKSSGREPILTPLIKLKDKLLKKQKAGADKTTDTVAGPGKYKQTKASQVKRPRPLLLIIIVFALGILIYALSAYSEARKEKICREGLNTKVSQLLASKKKLQDKLNQTTEELKKLGGGQETDSAGETPQVSAEDKERAKKLEEEKNGLAQKYDILTRNLEEGRSTISGLREELVQLKDSKARLEEKMAALAEKPEMPAPRLKGAETPMVAIDLARAEKRKLDIRELEVRVLVVDKRSQLVAIDAGEVEGIMPGAEFDIYKDAKLWGRIKIDQVNETVSIGRIIPGVGIGRISEGMKARRR